MGGGGSISLSRGSPGRLVPSTVRTGTRPAPAPGDRAGNEAHPRPRSADGLEGRDRDFRGSVAWGGKGAGGRRSQTGHSVSSGSCSARPGMQQCVGLERSQGKPCRGSGQCDRETHVHPTIPRLPAPGADLARLLQSHLR